MHTLIHVQTYSYYFEIRFTCLVMYVLVLKLKVVSRFVSKTMVLFFLCQICPQNITPLYRYISSMGNTFFFTSHRIKNKDFICLSFGSQDHIHVQQFDK